MPAYLNDELKLAKSESARIDKQIAQRKLNMDATRKHFAEEKAHFIALKRAIASAMPATEPTPAPNNAAAKTTAVKPN